MPTLYPKLDAPLSNYMNVQDVVEKPLDGKGLADHVAAFDGNGDGRVTYGETKAVFDAMQNTSKSNVRLAATIILGVEGRRGFRQVEKLIPLPKGGGATAAVLGTMGKVARGVFGTVNGVRTGLMGLAFGAKIPQVDEMGPETHVGGAQVIEYSDANPGKKTLIKPELVVAMVEKYGTVVDGEVRLYESQMKRLVDESMGAEKKKGTGFIARAVGKAAALGELTGFPFQVVNNVDDARGGDRWISVSDFVGILEGSFWTKYKRPDAE